jgi:hypothetical protein
MRLLEVLKYQAEKGSKIVQKTGASLRGRRLLNYDY